jgi:hypothetical protein
MQRATLLYAVVFMFFSSNCLAARVILREVVRNVQVSVAGDISMDTGYLYDFESDVPGDELVINLPSAGRGRLKSGYSCTMSCGQVRVDGERRSGGMLFQDICEKGRVSCLVSIRDDLVELPGLFADRFAIASDGLARVVYSVSMAGESGLYWEVMAEGMKQLESPKDNPVEGGKGRWLFLKEGADAVLPGVMVHVSNIVSWQRISAEYARLWQEQCRGFQSPGPEKISPGAVDDKARITGLLDYMSEHFRHETLKHAGHYLVPASCGKTWEKRCGDCKDFALLISFVLASWGTDAVPALRFRHGMGKKGLPDPFVFDHAVVIVDEKWVIDPSAFTMSPFDSAVSDSFLILETGENAQ